MESYTNFTITDKIYISPGELCYTDNKIKFITDSIYNKYNGRCYKKYYVLPGTINNIHIPEYARGNHLMIPFTFQCNVNYLKLGSEIVGHVKISKSKKVYLISPENHAIIYIENISNIGVSVDRVYTSITLLENPEEQIGDLDTQEFVGTISVLHDSTGNTDLYYTGTIVKKL